jgi:hypothetical protein
MEQPKPVAPSLPGAGRPERPLGRGLEDVARVFLSEPERAVDPGAGRRPARTLPAEAAAPGPLLLRPAQGTREQVAAALKEFEGALEDGLRMIDAEIPCPPWGQIDLLAVDRASQLTIVDFETSATDELLIRGLGHVDWVVANVPNLRRMFRGQAINFALQPRLMLLAPRFSSRVSRATRQLAHLQIAWVRYHFVETPGRPGIFFEHLESE